MVNILLIYITLIIISEFDVAPGRQIYAILTRLNSMAHAYPIVF